MNLDWLLLNLGIASLVSALIPACLSILNLRRYRPAPSSSKNRPGPAISVLIPARDEEAGIELTLNAVLANEGVRFEVIVLDDQSTDATAEIVGRIAADDPRVRLTQAPPLPDGWSGKQHACWRLAHLARNPFLLFLDADVTLRPDALARSSAFLRASGADLVSGIPHEETGGLMERLVIPLIHFVLLGFLPMGRMRKTTATGYAAGCGQFFLTRKDSYLRAGGHAEIRDSFHDGIRLPRAYRRAGLKTDLFDATDLATCRMYRSATSLWNGLAKNAGEGLAAPRLIVPMSMLLLLGQVLPIPLFLVGLLNASLPRRDVLLTVSSLAVAASMLPRLVMSERFRQSRLGAILHPVGVLVLLAIQWYSLGLRLTGRRVAWKGRVAPDSKDFHDQAVPFVAEPEDVEPRHESDRTVENSAWR